MLTCLKKGSTPKDDLLKNNNHSKRFPFSNFTYCWTLSSEFFSSFPHGTCSLSVSCRYLALDGVYHPFWIAIPNNPTLWNVDTFGHHLPLPTGFSPSMTKSTKVRHVPMDLNSKDTLDTHFSKLQLAGLHQRFQIWAISVSFAITQEILVSFFSSAY